ncbi:MAG: hypothetical protein KC636_24835, partial [Myxococcales bacterium]|nr:hypothetical protein [Myxococcales bacterium]
LYHRDAGGPMVLATTGYGLPNPKSLQEPTLLLAGANQLTVEQRFFGPSRPEPPDWSKLTIYQAATDHHRIVEALRPLYPGSWASTGASKGGMTSVYHRRFYPGDVDATVAYVAPHNLAALDDRYTPFVDGLGASACAQALRDVQADALARRAALVDLLAKYADNEGVSFDRLGLDRVVEFSVLESRFVFWQYGGADGCVGVPTAQASDAEVFAFLDGVAPWRGFGDELLDYYGPYYYQAATQLGAPEVDEDHLGELRLYPGEDVPALYAPEGAPIVFDDDAMPDIASWLNGAREPVMFVYGGGDPWTAAAFDPGGATAAPVYFVADGNHGSKLTDLAMDDFDEALALLRSWTGVADAAPAELLRSRARAAEAPAFRHARP